MLKEIDIPFNGFKGIETSLGKPSSNSFEELVNWIPGKVAGALSNRFGMRSVHDIPSVPDAFTVNKFKDFESLVFASNQKLYANPGIVDDSILYEMIDLSSAFTDTIQLITSTTKFSIGIVPTNVGLKYNICFNITKGQYAVVSDISRSTFTTAITTHRAYTWTAGDVVVFFKSKLSVAVVDNVLTPSADTSVGNWTPTPIHSLLSNRSNTTPVVATVSMTTTSNILNPNSLVSNSGWGVFGGTANAVLADGTDDTWIRTTIPSTIVVGLSNPTGNYISLNPVTLYLRCKTVSTFRVNVLAKVYDNGVQILSQYITIYPGSSFVNYPFSFTPSSFTDNGQHLTVELITEFDSERIIISKLYLDVPVLLSQNVQSFTESLSNLSDDAVLDTNGTSTLRFSVSKSNNDTIVNLNVKIKEGSTVLVQQDYILNESLFEYSLQLPNSIVTDFDSLSVVVSSISLTGGTTQVQIYYMNLSVGLSSPVADGGGLLYSKIAYPRFLNVDNSGSMIIPGIITNTKNTGIWIGKIDNRRYFGDNGFLFNGIYLSSIIDTLTDGAFTEKNHHIQVKTIDASSVLSESVSVNTGVAATQFGFTHNSSSIQAAVVTEDSLHAAGGNTPGGLNYIKVKLSALSGNPDVQGVCSLKILAKGQGAIVSFNLVNSTTLIHGEEILLGANYPSQYQSIPIDVSSIQSFSDLYVVVNVVRAINGHDIEIDRIYMEVPLASDINGITAQEDSVYVVNTSFVEDGFNDTKVLYSEKYGTPSSVPSTYQDANNLILTEATSGTKIIVVRVGTTFAELINRRFTHMRVLGGILLNGGVNWKVCRTVDLSSNNWKFSNGEYYIEVNVGDEINTGELHNEKIGLPSSYTAVNDIAYADHSLTRTFAVPNENRKTVVYSPINDSGYASSILPAKNFFQIVDTPGDINGLVILDKKLIIFKETACYEVSLESIPSSPKPLSISKEYGLVGDSSYAVYDKSILIFASHDGIRITDGFKSKVCNPQWINEYKSYSLNQLRQSIAFIDSNSRSFYLYIKTGASSSDLWVMDLVTFTWRQERFTHTDGVSVFGTIAYVSKNLDNRLLFADGLNTDYRQIYEFPRADNLYTDRIKTSGGYTEFPVQCRFITNQVDDVNLRFGLYIDSGQIKSNYVADDEGAPGLITIYQDESVIKSVPIIFQRQRFNIFIPFSIDRMALGFDALLTRETIITDITISGKVSIQSGSNKGPEFQ